MPRPTGAPATLPPALVEMLASGRTRTAAGAEVELHSGLTIELATALHRLVLARRPALVVEVGMAYGVSTLAILGALEAAGGDGRLVSIDPAQLEDGSWAGAGVAAVERAGLAHRHRLLAEPDFAALPRLLADGARAQVAFIDGWHTFDHVLLDFFYLDRMLDVGGVVGFDDCHYSAVARAIAFAFSHRDYRELDAGLPRPRASLRRGRAGAPANRYLEKTGERVPSWDFYADF